MLLAERLATGKSNAALEFEEALKHRRLYFMATKKKKSNTFSNSGSSPPSTAKQKNSRSSSPSDAKQKNYGSSPLSTAKQKNSRSSSLSDAKQIMLKESKRSMYIYTAIFIIPQFLIAAGFTLAELKWDIINTDPDYRLKMFQHIIKDYWSIAFVVSAVIFLCCVIIAKHFARMINELTAGERLRYLETYKHLPWSCRMHPGIVYSDKYILVSSFRTLFKTRKIPIHDIKSVSCGNAGTGSGATTPLGRRQIIISVYLKNEADIFFVCAGWDMLPLYVLSKKSKIPHINGDIPKKQFDDLLNKKED